MTGKISILMTGYYAKDLYEEAQRVLEKGEEPLNPIVRVIVQNKLGDIAVPCAAPKLLTLKLAPFVRVPEAYSLLSRMRGVERVMIETPDRQAENGSDYSWAGHPEELVPDYPGEKLPVAHGKRPGLV